MPIYHQLGRVPRKRHVAFRKDDGSLHYEELVGNQGFTGPSSLLYHLRLPTAVKSVRPVRGLGWVAEPERVVRHRHFRTAGLATGPSPVLDRVPLLFNADVAISMARPRKEDAFFYRNGQGDEVVYVVEGEGVLESSFGELPFRPGDYVVIPRGILHRWRLGAGPHRLLVIESAGYVRTPKRYRNEHGQLTEMAPFSERDVRRPERARDPRRDRGLPGRGEERQPPRRDGDGPPPARRGGLGRLLLPVGAEHPRLRAAGGPGPPAAAGAPDVRGRGLGALLLLPAPVRLREGRGGRALQPPERDVGRGALLRERRVHEPEGHRDGLDHAPPRRARPRPAAGQDRGSRSGRRARASSRSWWTRSGPSS